MSLSQEVVLELTEMKKIGMRVPTKAIKLARDEAQVAQYDNMRVSEIADLLISLASIR
jgi:hypothetical protein